MDFLNHTNIKNSEIPESADPCVEKEFAPRYQQKKINVFISSTFRDMKLERDELTLRVFPELRKVCEERGIAWGEVDLRWGIPEEKKGEVLSTCLKFIDECRPYFIGMLGERYGWVEETAPEEIIRDHPWITDHKGKSITELEILHGVLNNPAMAGHAYFYFRDPAYIKTLPDSQQAALLESPTEQEIADYGPEESVKRAEYRKDQLVALKKRIKESGLTCRENYRDPVRFGELVREDLMRVIDSLAPPPKPLLDAERAGAALEREDMAHEAFAASRFGVYIPRKEYFNRLDAHAAGNSQPLVVVGKSGSGKSALLAHWAFRYRKDHPDDLVLVHFIGASSDSTDWSGMLRRFMGEFKRKFTITEEIPAQDEALMATFRNWLSMAAARGRVVLVIDALNQLEDRNGALDLVWLPPKVPENIRLIVSTLEGRPLDEARERGWATLDVEPLTISERKALITGYLKKYHKELSPELTEELASAPQCENPLFLRALLEEIRIHGVFEKLVEQIREYLTAQTIDALFEKILARYEHDYERDRPCLVKDSVSLIWAARRGLSRPELMDLLGNGGKPLPAAYWAPFYLAMEHSLVEKDGRITFFHEYLRSAVEHRYLPTIDLKQTVHRQIADYFVDQPDGLRRTEELPWQLIGAAHWDQLVSLLADPTFFLNVWYISEQDIKLYWVQIEKGSSHRLVGDYYQSIMGLKNIPVGFLLNLHLLFFYNGHLNEAKSLGTYLIEESRKRQDKVILQRILCHQSFIFNHQGNPDYAINLLKEQENICRDIKDKVGLAVSLGNQAIILKDQGNLDEALRLCKEQEQICRELGYMDGLQNSLGNQALILDSLGDPEGALKLHKEEESICQKLGNKTGFAESLGNQASILIRRGNPGASIDLFKKQEQICRELGYMDGLQNSLGNQALILKSLGDPESALKLHKEEENICRKLGNKAGLAKSLGNQATIHLMRGKLDDALKLNQEVEKIFVDLKNPWGLQITYNNLAHIYYLSGNLDGALHHLKEAESICRKRKYKAGLAISLLNQAMLLDSRGDQDGALKLNKEGEQLYRELNDKDGIASSLNNQANIIESRGNLDDALKMHKEVEYIFCEIRNQAGRATSLGNQGRILKKQGNLDGARALYKEEEAICREIQDIMGVARSLNNQGLLLLSQGYPDGAMLLLKDGEQISKEHGDPMGIAISLMNQALVLSKQKLTKEAESTAEAAHQIASRYGFTKLLQSMPLLMKEIQKEK